LRLKQELLKNKIMLIIVGLGNPIKSYLGTRHNIGQAVVSYFQKMKNFKDFSFNKKFFSFISEGMIDDKKIILVLPQTFMNESGKVIKKIFENWKLKIKNLIVVHDDIDLPLGKIRVRTSGSSGGHKGVQSIIDALKRDDFIRIKIGVANERRKKIPADKFVLEKFEKDEKEIVEKIKIKTVDILSNLIKNKIKNQTFSL